MRAIVLFITLFEAVLAAVWGMATYHAFTDPSGGPAQGCVALILGMLVFGLIFYMLHALKDDF